MLAHTIVSDFAPSIEDLAQVALPGTAEETEAEDCIGA